jgi:hypothetical protein
LTLKTIDDQGARGEDSLTHNTLARWQAATLRQQPPRAHTTPGERGARSPGRRPRSVSSHRARTQQRQWPRNRHAPLPLRAHTHSLGLHWRGTSALARYSSPSARHTPPQLRCVWESRALGLPSLTFFGKRTHTHTSTRTNLAPYREAEPREVRRCWFVGGSRRSSRRTPRRALWSRSQRVQPRVLSL